jgi:hypothetical protein
MRTATTEAKMIAANIAIGSTVQILNKYGDEIASGSVVEVERDGFTLDTGDAVLFRTIAQATATEIRLNVTGAQL